MDRILLKRDDEQIKREFLQDLLKQEMKDDQDQQQELSGFDFFGDHQEPFEPYYENEPVKIDEVSPEEAALVAQKAQVLVDLLHSMKEAHGDRIPFTKLVTSQSGPSRANATKLF